MPCATANDNDTFEFTNNPILDDGKRFVETYAILLAIVELRYI